MEYLLSFAVLAGIYSILALSLNILVGEIGIISVAQGAIFGIGAYTSALLVLHLHLPFLLALAAGIVVTGLFSAVVAIPSLRVKGDYFIVAAFGVQFVIHDIFLNLVDVTRGAGGIRHIPRASVFGLKFDSNFSYLCLTLFFVLLVISVYWRIKVTPVGRLLRAIRSDEVAVQALGKNVYKSKVMTTVASGSLAAIAGSLYAHYLTYIDPSVFTIHDSIFILAMIIVGGMGSITGSIMGAVILLGLPEILRFLAIPDAIAGPGRQIVYGILLILFMRFRTKGLFGKSF